MSGYSGAGLTGIHPACCLGSREHGSFSLFCSTHLWEREQDPGAEKGEQKGQWLGLGSLRWLGEWQESLSRPHPAIYLPLPLQPPGQCPTCLTPSPSTSALRPQAPSWSGAAAWPSLQCPWPRQVPIPPLCMRAQGSPLHGPSPPDAWPSQPRQVSFSEARAAEQGSEDALQGSAVHHHGA